MKKTNKVADKGIILGQKQEKSRAPLLRPKVLKFFLLNKK